MSFRQKHESGNRAVAWLATCCVGLGGAVSCAAIAVAADPEHLESALIPVGGVVVGMIVPALAIARPAPREPPVDELELAVGLEKTPGCLPAQTESRLRRVGVESPGPTHCRIDPRDHRRPEDLGPRFDGASPAALLRGLVVMLGVSSVFATTHRHYARPAFQR